MKSVGMGVWGLFKTEIDCDTLHQEHSTFVL